MELTPHDIHQKQFHDAWRGYNQEEVDDFLDRAAEALGRMQQENASLKGRLRELEQAVTTSREAEEMLKKTLVTAQQAAEEAISKARAKADELISEAEARSRRAQEETRDKAAAAEVELQRKSAEADRIYSQRKRELDGSIDRLTAYQTELKHRLKSFLEQQLRALDGLPDTLAPDVASTRGEAVAARQQGRPVATPSPRVAGATPRPHPAEAPPPAESPPRPGPGVVPTEEESGSEPAGDADEEGAVGQGSSRRGVKGLFWREDG